MERIRRLNDDRTRTDAKAAQKKRLAEALRTNLKRRKVAAGRAEPAESQPAEPPADKG